MNVVNTRILKNERVCQKAGDLKESLEQLAK